jgi:hypothetical protein
MRAAWQELGTFLEKTCRGETWRLPNPDYDANDLGPEDDVRALPRRRAHTAHRQSPQLVVVAFSVCRLPEGFCLPTPFPNKRDRQLIAPILRSP